MKVIKYYFILIFLITNIIGSMSFVDPASLAVGGVLISSIVYLFNKPEMVRKQIEMVQRIADRFCQKIGFCEGCEDYWIPGNLEGLKFDLKNGMFGQDIAVKMVLSALEFHLKSEPQRSLILSFQGGPGTGKNFMSEKILKNMFRNGENTRYVKTFRSSIDFPSKTKVEQYKETVITQIMKMAYECHRSVIVFDEVEKMPAGILDVISGVVNAKQIGDYNFRRLIFILLSNVGSETLVEETLKAYQNSIPRENINTKHLQYLLSNDNFNKNGGLQGSRLIQNHDISFHVPFLPLDRGHITLCLEKEAERRGQPMSQALVESVFEELYFNPEPFCSSGCKGVAEKAAYLFERERRKRRQ